MSSTILLLGSRGFVGRHILRALEADGHRVRRADRPEVDLVRDVDAVAWNARLQGIDVVVNAAGIFREHGDATFDAVHVAGPAALFEACARAGTPVVQVSALGADADARSRFHRSKCEGDTRLLALDVPSLVLQPSLIHGAGGTSARLFTMLASMPLVPLPGDGEQRIQPVHVMDVAAAVSTAIAHEYFPRERLAVVGPEAMSVRAWLARIRRSLGLGEARFIAMPRALMALAAALRIGLLDRESLGMLERGNVADPAPLRSLLGREPTPVPPQQMDDAARAGARTAALLSWLLPLLRGAIALTWIAAGVVSAGPYPVSDSLALLARTGLHGGMAYAALYGASALDIAMGVATLFLPRRRLLWLAQMVLVAAYTLIITVFLPEQWLHPYGPVVKNLPILAALLLLHQLEPR